MPPPAGFAGDAPLSTSSCNSPTHPKFCENRLIQLPPAIDGAPTDSDLVSAWHYAERLIRAREAAPDGPISTASCSTAIQHLVVTALGVALNVTDPLAAMRNLLVPPASAGAAALVPTVEDRPGGPSREEVSELRDEMARLRREAARTHDRVIQATKILNARRGDSNAMPWLPVPNERDDEFPAVPPPRCWYQLERESADVLTVWYNYYRPHDPTVQDDEPLSREDRIKYIASSLGVGNNR